MGIVKTQKHVVSTRILSLTENRKALNEHNACFGVFLYFRRVAMNRTLKEQLKDWTRNNKEYRSKPQKRRDEVLTEADIKTLMGVNKPVYRRHRGAYRQR